MRKQDWMTACVTAVLVAMTVAVLAPPVCWAEETTLVAIPALPSAELTIPAINGKVSATATPAPGEAVKVTLTLECPAGSAAGQAPVTVTVWRTTMDIFSRSLPPSQQVAQVSTVVPIGSDGCGSAVVELPLIWAAKATVKPEATANAQQNQARDAKQVVTSYRMVLSSSPGEPVVQTNLLLFANNVQNLNLVNAPVAVMQQQ